MTVVGPIGTGSGDGDVEFLELDLVLPHLAQEILKYLDRELLAGTAPVTKTKGRKSCGVADRQRLVVDDAIDGAITAVVHDRLSTVRDFKSSSVEGTFGKSDLLAFGFVDLMAGRGSVVAVGIELVGVRPLHGIKTGGLVRADHVAMPLKWRNSNLLYGRYAPAIWRDCTEQLHHKTLERREGIAGCIIGIALHGLFEPGFGIGITGVLRQLQHDVVHGVAPLAQGHEVVKAFEHNISMREILSIAGVFDPVVGKSSLWVGCFAADNIGKPVVDPLLQVVEVPAHGHIVLIDDLLCRITIGEDGVEALPDLVDSGGMASPFTPRCKSQYRSK